MDVDCSKYKCTKCCEKYWINFTLSEAQKIADFLKISFEQFIQEKTVILFQVFPLKSEKSVFLEEAGKEVLIVPVRALLKEEKCIFLKEGKCSIYPVCPEVCKLFPNIGGGNLKEKYSFCPFLQENSFIGTKKWEEHYALLKESFSKTLDLSLWNIPKRNFLYYPQDEKEFEISFERAKAIISLL